jgi:MOSC domain-containing protein YiiM
MTLLLHQTRIGLPKPLGNWNGHDIVSAIDKKPVTGQVEYFPLGIVGDGQANLKVHGGIDKAVYAYPREHYLDWNRELGTSFEGGAFGENLVVSGMLEDEVRVGDIWKIGDVLLKATKPRQPCFKLIMHSRVDDIIQRMRSNGRTGWYLEVVRDGTAPTAGNISLIERGQQTIADNYAGKVTGPINPDFFGPQGE